MKEMHKKDWSHVVVFDEETGEWFLDAVCGSVGIYSVGVRLLPSEIEAFQQNPDALDGLASKIAYDPSQFADRAVTLYFQENGQWSRSPTKRSG